MRIVSGVRDSEARKDELQKQLTREQLSIVVSTEGEYRNGTFVVLIPALEWHEGYGFYCIESDYLKRVREDGERTGIFTSYDQALEAAKKWREENEETFYAQFKRGSENFVALPSSTFLDLARETVLAIEREG